MVLADISKQMESWGEGRQIILAVMPKFSSLLSICGSFWIVRKLILEWKKARRKSGSGTSNAPVLTSVKTILLGMSLYDIMVSGWTFCSTWPMPKGTEGVFGAVGNKQSCVAQGFFIQFGMAVPAYNAFLSLYYLLVIKYGVKEQVLRTKYVVWMHVAAFVLPLATAVTTLVLDGYQPANLWCHIMLPDSDGSSWLPTILRWTFYYGPLWFIMLLSFVAMGMVFCAVSNLEQRTLKYRKPQLHFQCTAAAGTATATDSRPPQPEQPPTASIDAVVTASDTNDTTETQQGDIEAPVRDVTERTVTSADPSCCDSTASSPVAAAADAPRKCDGAATTSASSTGSNQSSKQQRRLFKEGHERSRDVFYQALFYFLAFLLTYVFATVNRAVQTATGQAYYPLMVLEALFYPLEGFMNFLVYRRPSYIQLRRSNPEVGRLGAAARTLRWSSIRVGQSPTHKPATGST